MAIVHELDVAATCERLLGRPVVASHRIRGGRNNQVFRVECAETAVVVKHYFTSAGDPRDRLSTEYGALRLLRANGITAVPTPLAIDRDARCVVYECMPGAPAASQAASDADVDQAVAFLADLRTLARRSRADVANAASEAYYSIDAVIEHVAARAARVRAVPADTAEGALLAAFMAGRFAPTMDALRGWTGEAAHRLAIRTGVDIPPAERTLSPSDFGLHNALRDDAGRLAFVDFEYFGWDDPAKLVSDFLLHPGMILTPAQRMRFLTGARAIFGGDDSAFAARLKALYPLYGLCWVLILLNEYLPERWARRAYSLGPVNRGDVLARQLSRARAMLERIESSYATGPHVG